MNCTQRFFSRGEGTEGSRNEQYTDSYSPCRGRGELDKLAFGRPGPNAGPDPCSLLDAARSTSKTPNIGCDIRILAESRRPDAGSGLTASNEFPGLDPLIAVAQLA